MGSVSTIFFFLNMASLCFEASDTSVVVCQTLYTPPSPFWPFVTPHSPERRCCFNYILSSLLSINFSPISYIYTKVRHISVVFVHYFQSIMYVWSSWCVYDVKCVLCNSAVLCMFGVLTYNVHFILSFVLFHIVCTHAR